MSSTVWQNPIGGSLTGAGGMVTGESSMAENRLNSQLASALSTMGSDSQFFEDSISPSSIRTNLSASDPSNPSSIPTLTRGMKWLLASLSKGRDVSDFYPHVVKLVGVPSLEVRKLVYMYLVHYADHDASTRELSLLSINSFQRGLADHEQLIRALALRVLSSIRVPDILQIQILACRKCATDDSPYVRKCAANALAKLYGQCTDIHMSDSLLAIMQTLLEKDSSTMVLTSAIIAFNELCPDRLDLLHGAFRKICHLLTDMDEWGQVVVIDTMARYCRRFFKEPHAMKHGSAELIDKSRRIVRTTTSTPNNDTSWALDTLPSQPKSIGELKKTPALPERVEARKVKRRVVKKAFYSDEEDESEEEEVEIGSSRRTIIFGGGHGGGSTNDKNTAPSWNNNFGGPASAATQDTEDEDIDEDHKLLLKASFPLLKSRNSGVVLAVCSLHYYCGVSNISTRSAMGKAMVRIHRDRREIQYVVLTSIRSLVRECPSAFTPYLNDFFVKAMDPSFTRKTKLEILTSLALEPASIKAVLNELRTYVRHEDRDFVRASVCAVGRIAELARIVFDRHGAEHGTPEEARMESDTIALNCLYGLTTLTETCDEDVVVGECVVVIERILLMLQSSSLSSSRIGVQDPNHVQSMSLTRLILLLVRALATGEEELDDDDDDEEDDEPIMDDDLSKLKNRTVLLPQFAVGPAVWIVGELLTTSTLSSIQLYNVDTSTRSRMKVEILRLIAAGFPDFDSNVKLQCLHFASKALLAMGGGSTDDVILCEHILSMGRVDLNQDVRDRARYESNVLHMSVGLTHETDALCTAVSSEKKLTMEKAKTMLLALKPSPSSVPLDGNGQVDQNSNAKGPFRFGTLSSLLSHRAGEAYLPLPPWGQKDSPSSLRDPPKEKVEAPDIPTRATGSTSDGWKVQKGKPTTGFYDSDNTSTSSDDESSSSDSSSSESETEDDSSESSSEDESSSESDSDSPDNNLLIPISQPTHNHAVANGGIAPPKSSSQPTQVQDVNESSSEDDSSDDSSGDEESTSSEESFVQSALMGQHSNNLLQMNQQPEKVSSHMARQTSSASSLAEGFEGLVMAPLVVDNEASLGSGEADMEKDSSVWTQMVRPELGGGLSAKARYLRGPTRDREAKNMGLNPDSASCVCVQILFENRRSDSGTLRRVRMIQRGGTGIVPKRVIVPQEVGALKKDQMSAVVLGLDFASISDKDGASMARFDIKSDRGSNSIDVRPPLGEMLQPCVLNRTKFDNIVQRFKGIHQKVVSTFKLNSDGGGLKEEYEDLPHKILKQCNLTPMERNNGWKDDKCIFIALSPASGEHICVIVDCNPQTGEGSITICCDNALVSNSIMDILKPALGKK